MAGFLTEAWVAAMDDAAGRADLPAGVDLVVQQVVRDGDAEQAYAVVIRDGRARVQAGRVADPDVTFTQDRAVAGAIARGELSAQAAFMAGHLRIGGDVPRLVERARELAALDDLFAPTREATTW